jgi:Carboxypeptidase regulatory-like domain
VNKLTAPSSAALATRRSYCYRRAGLLFLALSGLLVGASGNVVTALAQSQPTAPQPASTPATTPGQKPEVKKETTTAVTGTIKGRVVSDDGRPLTNASVTATTNAGSTRAAGVDSEGRFVFDELPAAVYVILATAPGYIDPSLATGEPSQWPRHLIGAQIGIPLIKGGVITGTVTDSRGEAIVGVPVKATLANGPDSSILNFVGGGGSSESNDRGVYRIYGLLPGQYTVSAGGGREFGQFGANGFDLDVPTYYPSSTRDTAIPVSVRSGDATTGIDIKYRGLEGHSISGVVLGMIEAGAGAVSGTGSFSPVTVLLSHAGTISVLSIAIASVADERRAFSFNGIADGEYDVLASFASGPNESAVVGTKRVTVRGGDVTGIELRLAPLSSIAGTIVLDAIKPEDKCDKRGSQLVETGMEAPRDDRKKSGSQALTGLFAGFGGAVNDKGEFAIRNLEAGRYRLEIKLPTESWYVRAINLTAAPPQPSPSGPPSEATPNQRNTWQGVVTLKAGERISGVSIEVGQDAASIRGRVATSGEGTVVPAELRVHLIPADREQANNVLRYSETTVDSNSSFKFTNIAPGRYFIASRVEPPAESDAAPRPAAWDPTVRAKLRREAEAAKTVVELKPCQAMVDYQLKPSAAQ